MLRNLFRPNIDRLARKNDVAGLIKALRWKRYSTIPQQASQALRAIGGPALDHLVKAITSDDYLKRPSDLLKATYIDIVIAGECRYTIYDLATHLDSVKKRAAVEDILVALGELPAWALLEFINNTNNEAAIAIALGILGKIGQQAVIAILCARYDAYTLDIELQALRVLGDIGDETSVKPIIAHSFWDSGRGRFAKAGIEALIKIANRSGKQMVMSYLIAELQAYIDGRYEIFSCSHDPEDREVTADWHISYTIEILAELKEIGAESYLRKLVAGTGRVRTSPYADIREKAIAEEAREALKKITGKAFGYSADTDRSV